MLIGPKVNLITENHPLDPDDRKTLVSKPMVTKRNAWTGAAGAVVIADVPPNTIAAGIPAKHIKKI